MPICGAGLRLRSGPTLSEDVARFALQLDLPVLAGISVEDLMRVRNEYGEAFHAFRLTLQRHLRELRTLQDASVIEKKLQNLQHELEEVQVADVDLGRRSDEGSGEAFHAFRLTLQRERPPGASSVTYSEAWSSERLA